MASIIDTNLDDPKNIAGLSGLLGSECGDDLDAIEREIADGAGMSENEEINIANDYRREMERLSRNFEIGKPVTGDPDNSLSPVASVRTQVHSPTMSDVQTPVDMFNGGSLPDFGNDITDNDMRPEKYNPVDQQLRNMTQEERKQEKIHQVLNNIDDRELEFNIEKEKEEDDRASMMEQIDMLKITLEDDGIDISGVPKLCKNSSIKEVQTVYKIMRLKNDRNRYCSFAEELILSGAYGFEYLFDGKKEWFGRQPDLTGWSSTVKIKLRRMKFETSTFVGEVMAEYNMSAGMRLVLELIPSMFLYSRNRRISQSDSIVSDTQFKDAISQLNSMDNV
jgi:hypothetical protein